MRIYGVNYNIYNRDAGKKNTPANLGHDLGKKVLKRDVVNFTASVKNADILKALLAFKIPDLYSPVILLDQSSLNKIFEKNIFSSSIGKISKHLNPLTSSLFPTEYDFYNLIRNEARVSPNKSLPKFIKGIYPKYKKRLVSEQIPVFNKLKSLVADFPGELLEKYNYLMYISEKKINGEPVFIQFSVKEFKYKLNNIKKRIMASPNADEHRAMNKLISIASLVPDIPKEIRKSPEFKFTKYEDKQKVMIKKFNDYLYRSVLVNDKDLIELAENSEKRIYKVPINISFNRKSFIYDLQEITSQLEDKKLARLVNKTAISLPTSKQSLAAFVVKSAYRSPEQVGYDMLSPSLGSIDHLVASHNGGEDVLSNYALSSAYMNSLKAHKSFAEFYKHDKNIAEYAQAQVDRLIELFKFTEIFNEIKLGQGYINNLARKVEKLSKDPTLIIDTHGLK